MEIGQLHFLVADGDPLQREALAAMLTQLGAGHITQVPDGHNALRDFTGGLAPAVDIGIIDLVLPGMDGLELIRRLADMQCRAGIIIIGALGPTVLLSVETLAQAYGTHLLGTIDKPVTAAKVAELLAHYAPQAEAPAQRAAAPQFAFDEVARGLRAGEFDPYFQPKIELASGRVEGLEMFARWRHPEHGVLEPASFMAVLAENQRIDFLDWAMIEKTVAACRTLHDQNIPISFSINVDPGTLAHPQFMEQIDACLARHDVEAAYIAFEISESAVLTTDPRLLERLLRLRMAGFGLAIDDYGTGRSNLQLLARIPFSELKIDRSFVDGASKKSAIGTVLRSCLGLARSLDRRSVAVGVETKQDWDFVQGLGCNYAQGYYIAKPMPVQDFPAWLKDWAEFF
ncbi:EAL domain-containing response regulator [Rugamonas sp.]|uniref:EAL domain-containing response regulator n=1 Tax=Rugamonas sp. TaxID=1926287 RepID=UPI0025DF0FBE|nr:EAL domain-containing response regulator [Rugamonas sp.]